MYKGKNVSKYTHTNQLCFVPSLMVMLWYMVIVVFCKHHDFVHIQPLCNWNNRRIARGLEGTVLMCTVRIVPSKAIYRVRVRTIWMNMKWTNIHIAEMHSHHISVTDVCVTPSTLYPAHGGHRNAELTNNPGQKGAFWLEGRVGAVWVRVAGSWGLRWGNFSPLIALCGTSPGGTLTAVEAGDIWYIVWEALGQKAKHYW